MALKNFSDKDLAAADHNLATTPESASLTTLYAKSFGLSASASAVKNTQAFQQISAAINKAGGGIKLVIEKGVYNVGDELAANAQSKGFAFRSEGLLKLVNCNKPVVIEGTSAVLQFAPGLHFGSFHPTTKAAHKAPGGGFYDYNFTAYPQSMIELTGNKSVTVQNLVLDGNVKSFVLGGYWGDTGIQLPADGILAFDNAEVIVDRVISRYFPRDGIQIANTTPDEKSEVKKVFLRNSELNGNSRQGLSWVGGNHLYAENCRFVNTGKTINSAARTAVYSAPGAGVDMEAERGLIRNGVFKNCVVDNNAGVGFLSVGDVANIRFEGGKIIGATNWTIYGTGAKAVFDRVTIVGSPVNLRIGTGPSDKDNTQFNDCLITLDSTLSPTKKVYGNYVMDFGGGAGGFFNRCTIDSKNRGTVYGGGGCVFTDCLFKQEPTAAGYNGYPFMSGTFYGTNRWVRPGDGTMPTNLNKSKFYGPFYVNGVEVTGNKIKKS